MNRVKYGPGAQSIHSSFSDDDDQQGEPSNGNLFTCSDFKSPNTVVVVLLLLVGGGKLKNNLFRPLKVGNHSRVINTEATVMTLLISEVT